MWEIVVSLLLLYLLYGWWRKGSSHLSDIHGPKGTFPIGNLFQLNEKAPHLTVSEWGKKYGSIFKYKALHFNFVVVNSFDAIQEVLSSEYCASRMTSYRLEKITFEGWTDVITAKYSKDMNEKKKLLSRSLNAYGTGRLKIEDTTLDYIETLHENIRNHTDNFTESVDIRPLIYKRIAGVIMTLLYGRKLDDKLVLELIELEKGALKWGNPNQITALVDVFPLFRFFPIDAIQKPRKAVSDLRRWFIERYNEEEGEESIMASLKSFINKATGKLLESGDLLGITSNLVFAGFVTTTSSMYSLVCVLINHPEIQDRVYKEIQQVTTGNPKLSDRPNLPYTSAVLEENLRHSTAVPLSVPHYTMKDTTIQGKNIPKNTVILPDLWSMHHNEEYFPDPWKFRPERYLTPEGEMLPVSHEVRKHTLPFSTGKRICAGEGLARSRMYLVATNLLSKYKFLPEDGNNVPSCDAREYEGHTVIGPKPFKIRVELR